MKRAALILLSLALLAPAAYAVIPTSGGTIDVTNADGKITGGSAEEAVRGPVSAIGDFNGDGIGDLALLVREAGTGAGGRSIRIIFGGATLNGSLQQDRVINGVSGFAITHGGGRWLTAMAGAGDVNGDGKADLVVGSCDPAVGEPGSGADGDAFVVFGRAGTAPIDLGGASFGGFVVNRNGSECLGRSVAGGGDVNGDGKSDVIIGASQFQTSKGRAVVVYGKANEAGVATNPIAAPNGFDLVSSTDAGAGTHVAMLGDVNGDGKVDVGVGGRNYQGGPSQTETQSGAVWVVFNRSTSATLVTTEAGNGSGFRIEGAAAGHFAGPVAPAGDVNKDGKADIVVGAPGPNQPGVVGVIFGRTATSTLRLGGLGAEGYRYTTARAADLFGHEVRGAADFNGDATPDVVAGAPASDIDPANAVGKVYVLFGRPAGGDPISVSAFPSNAGVVINGNRDEQPNDSGSRIGTEGWIGLGDVTGDGGSDLLLGSIFSNLSTGGFDGGTVYILKNGSGGTGPGTTGPGTTLGPPPVLSGVKANTKRMRVGRRSTAISSARRRAPAGMSVRYTLSEPATMRFRITCVRPSKKVQAACAKLAKKNVITRKVLTSGRSNFSFSGRIGKRAIPLGRFKMTLQATDAELQTSNTATISFTVVRR